MCVLSPSILSLLLFLTVIIYDFYYTIFMSLWYSSVGLFLFLCLLISPLSVSVVMAQFSNDIIPYLKPSLAHLIPSYRLTFCCLPPKLQLSQVQTQALFSEMEQAVCSAQRERQEAQNIAHLLQASLDQLTQVTPHQMQLQSQLKISTPSCSCNACCHFVLD